MFFPLLLLEGLNLHVSGVKTIFGREPVKRRPVEIVFVTVRLGGYLALVFWLLPPLMALAFLGVQLAVFGLYMGAVFAPNHKGMPLVPKDARIDFLRRQVLMPRPHLRRVQPTVRAFCAANGVPYAETSLGGSYAIVVRYLNRVGLGARDPFQCPIAAEFRSAR